MKIALLFLIVVLGFGFAGNAKAEPLTVTQSAIAVFDAAGAGCFIGGVVGRGDGMKGCAIGAAIGTGAAALVIAGNAMAADAPSQEQLMQDEGSEQ